ncbi:MAG: NUDIX hydrolase [Patescibacteria group bacterium]
MPKKIQRDESIIFVSAILERMDGDVKKVFLQTRWKPKITRKYSGLLEIPGGRIDSYENVFDAVSREVKEECGLKVVAFRNFFRERFFRVDEFEKTMVFQPFMCQQVLNENDGKLWFGFVFICEVEGEPKMQKDETKDPMWASIDELKKLLKKQPEKIFPHQYQALKFYVDTTK